MNTEVGHNLYLVEGGPSLAKLGVAPDPRQRVRELQVGSPVRLKLVLSTPYPSREDARAVAAELSRQFALRQAHGSWFRVTAAEVRRALASEAIREAPARAACAGAVERDAPVAARAPRARTEKQLAYQRRRRRQRAAKQRRAARLLERGRSQVEVASALGVTARTLRNWRSAPSFLRALERERARAAGTPSARAPGSQPEQNAWREARREPRQEQAVAEAERAFAESPAAAPPREQTPERSRRGERSAAGGTSRHGLPLELEPFSDEWRGWYVARRHLSEIDLLNCNDALRGIVPPLERRARERAPTHARRKWRARQ